MEFFIIIIENIWNFIKEITPSMLKQKMWVIVRPGRKGISPEVKESIAKPETAQDYDEEMLYLYSNLYQEVFYNMIKLNPLEAGCDFEGLKSLMLGESPLGQILFPQVEEKLISKLGEDKIIDKLGEDKIIKLLGKRLGKKKIQELLDKIDQD